MTKPHGEGSEEKSINRNIYIKSGVKIDLGDDLKKQQQIAHDESTAHQNTQIFWTKVAATLLLLSAGFTFWQACSAERTYRLFQQSERPYVSIADREPLPLVPGQKVRCNVWFVNYGKTPAFEVLTTGKVFIGTDAMKQADDWFDSLGDRRLDASVGISTTIPPEIPSDPRKSSVFSTLYSDRSATLNDLNFIIANEFSAVAALRQQYTDTFGHVFQYDACFTKVSGPSPISVQCPKHNNQH